MMSQRLDLFKRWLFCLSVEDKNLGRVTMQNDDTVRRRYYFSTRDLLIMAVMAGLGGVASTAINALGDTFQAALGFAGTTQWAAGLHVVFLLLAVGLTNKGGAATITGLLKGGVELLSGNTHGITILIINLASGLLIDLALIPFRKKDSRWAYMVAGGLASASNVFVFQLFASAPEDVLAFIWGIAGLAFVSGALLGGLLAYALLMLLRRNGIAKVQPHIVMPRWRYPAFLLGFAALALGSGIYLSHTLAGPPSVAVTGDCAQAYEYSIADGTFEPVSLDLELQGMKRHFDGVPLRDIVAKSQPNATAGAVLVTATDGYSFFITFHEVEENDQLVLAHRGEKKDTSYEIAGAVNPKAWVRNVAEIRLVPQALIDVSGLLDRPFPYNPDDWQLEMDNGRFDFGEGEKKYQGTLLKDVIAKWQPSSEAATIVFLQRTEEPVELALDRVMADTSLRIWNVNTADGILFAIAQTDGDIYARDVISIVIK
jgi:energy-coupling factor transport system substrate-specific component